MPCDRIRTETREQIIQRATAALKSGRARLAKRAGRLTLEGLTEAEKGEMQDACILAGIARRADLLTRAKIHEAGETAENLIRQHGHTH